MKAIKFLIVAATFAASTADLRAEPVGPIPGPAPGVIPGGGSPMPPAAMDSGAMMPPGNYGGPSGPGYEMGGYCGDGQCGNGQCGNGYCGDQCGGGCGHGCGLFAGLCSHWNSGLYSSCGRSYAQIDAMMINRGTGYQQTLATSGGFPVLNSNQPWYGFETLPRLTFGYVLPNDTAVESSFFYKDDMNAWFGVTSAANDIVVPTLGGFSSVQLNFSTQIQNFELNVVETGRIFNFLAGFRYIELQDHMRLSATQLNGNTFAAAIDTYNSLLGGQVGLRSGFDVGLFRIEGTGKAGLFHNHGNGQTTLSAPGVVGATAPLAVVRSNGGDTQSFVGELNCSLTYRATASLAFRGGYQCYWIVDTGLAQSQYNPLNPAASGLAYNDQGDLILHGPSAGLDFRW